MAGTVVLRPRPVDVDMQAHEGADEVPVPRRPGDNSPDDDTGCGADDGASMVAIVGKGTSLGPVSDPGDLISPCFANGSMYGSKACPRSAHHVDLVRCGAGDVVDVHRPSGTAGGAQEGHDDKAHGSLHGTSSAGSRYSVHRAVGEPVGGGRGWHNRGVDQTVVSTPRLVVRQLVDEDAPFLHDLHSRPEVCTPLAMQPSADVGEELERIRRFRERFGPAGAFGIWALALLDGPPIGLVMLKPLRPLADHDGTEVGWRLHPDFWGDGYATEAASGLLRLAFSGRGLVEVVAVIEPSNLRSHAVAARIGMRKLGMLDYAGLPHDLLGIGLDRWRSPPEGFPPIGPRPG